MHAAIVIVGAAARVDVELLANAVDLPLEVAVLQFGNGVYPRALQQQITDDQAADVRRVRRATGLRERGQQRNRAEDRDADLRRYPEDDHQDGPVRKVERVGEQESVDRAGGADDHRVLHLLRKTKREQREDDGERAGADAGEEIELQEIARAPDPLQLGP